MTYRVSYTCAFGSIYDKSKVSRNPATIEKGFGGEQCLIGLNEALYLSGFI